ncbi:hypothetical protein CGC20_26330 [Leishmania donovani]|uniref:Uncharacterized protein n=2 Tax=Leishmania donovani TaxID=5661 RepID=A0A504XUQ0_LEIDO|nr:hypothetical protein CGC20_26330 [Leishmania donovani]
MPCSFDTINTLFRPLSTSQHDGPSASTTAAVIELYMRLERLAIQSGSNSRPEIACDQGDNDGSATSVRASQRGSAVSCRLDGGRLRSTSSPQLFLLGDDGVVRELATALQVSSSSLLNSHDNTPPHGTGLAAALDGIIGDAQSRVYGTPDTPSSFLRRADEDSGTLAPSSSSHAAAPPPEVYTLSNSLRGLESMRPELCGWCNVVLLCYHVANPVSLALLGEEVAPSVLAALATAAHLTRPATTT